MYQTLLHRCWLIPNLLEPIIPKVLLCHICALNTLSINRLHLFMLTLAASILALPLKGIFAFLMIIVDDLWFPHLNNIIINCVILVPVWTHVTLIINLGLVSLSRFFVANVSICVLDDEPVFRDVVDFADCRAQRYLNSESIEELLVLMLLEETLQAISEIEA